jgi:peptidoglycan/xylan/chitin deacetylase (PgdA/CDA1 family)
MSVASFYRSFACAIALGLFLVCGNPIAKTLACKGTLYLTLDTGHMEPAEEIAATINKHGIKATFFLANEKTKRGDMTLDPAWAKFWKARAEEGHAFGSHTWRHWYFRRDIGAEKVAYMPWGKSNGADGDALDRQQLCQELKQSDDAFKSMTGRPLDKIWRAPGGKLTPNTLAFSQACGYKHVEWSPAGFSGDELPSESFSSNTLIAKQLRDIKDGDILLWHLGIWSRKDALYPRLDELLTGLKAKGFCFAKITDHPRWK